MPPFAATEDGAENDEEKEGEGAGIDCAVRTSSASQELPRPEAGRTMTSFSKGVLSSNGTVRDGEERLLVSSVARSAGDLTSGASSASPRILKPARAALSRPQASALRLLVGSGGDTGEVTCDRKKT